jgi:hypothetical protein
MKGIFHGINGANVAIEYTKYPANTNKPTKYNEQHIVQKTG